MIIRRLGPGDEDVVVRLATYAPPSREHAATLLADPRTFFVVAFESDEPIGFVLAHELLRRHGDPSSLYVYEVETAEEFRGRGVATALMRALAAEARKSGIPGGFLTTEEANEPAMRLYESAGGVREGVDVVWQFDYGRGAS